MMSTWADDLAAKAGPFAATSWQSSRLRRLINFSAVSSGTQQMWRVLGGVPWQHTVLAHNWVAVVDAVTMQCSAALFDLGAILPCGSGPCCSTGSFVLCAASCLYACDTGLVAFITL